MLSFSYRFSPAIAILVSLALGSPSFCQEKKPSGEQLYNLYCSACHGPDGNGASGALFPPLAESEWVKGDPSRMISVILHGLHEPVLVKGTTYNLEMPPQGSILNDEQIAAISTYVRSSFGNKEAAVGSVVVRDTRERHKDRTGLWTAPELLMGSPLPPLPMHRWGVKDLTVTVYDGEWEEMPDFDKLVSVSEEKEDGPISLNHAGGRRENFAIVWEGRMESPGDHDSNFFLSSVGGARMFYNGQLVFELEGQGQHYRHTSARAKAQRGSNTFRLEYFQKGKLGGLALHRSGGTMGNHPLTDTDRDPNAAAYPDILIGPKNGRTAIYRNTIEGVSARAIGIGLHGGINYGFSASTLAMELVWTGKFMNAGLHWTVRGTGAQPPEGEDVVSLGRGLGLARLQSPTDKWPGRFDEDWDVRFLGYELDETNRPTFRYSIAGVLLEDKLQQGESSAKSLKRLLSVKVPEGASTDELYLRLASGEPIIQTEGGYSVNNALKITSAQEDRLVPVKDSLLFKLAGLPAGEHQFSITYTWPQQ